MRYVPIYLDVLHAADRAEAARAAARRAMYARPDADRPPALEPVRAESRIRAGFAQLVAAVRGVPWRPRRALPYPRRSPR